MVKKHFILGSPSAYHYAENRNISLESVCKALEKDFLTLEDVLSFVEKKHNQDSTNNNYPNKYWNVDHSQYGDIREEKLDKFSVASMNNLVSSAQNIPVVTHGDDVSIEKLNTFITQLKQDTKDDSTKITVLTFFIKALAITLEKFPKFNSSLSADFTNIIYKDFIHIGVAVNTDYGLIVPVIRNVDKKNIMLIAKELNKLSTLAREKKLTQEHTGGASMTISNLGRNAGRRFTPIINPPEVSILGVSKAFKAPVWNGQNFVDQLSVPFDLTYDHRVINGIMGADFFNTFATIVSNPELMV